MPCLGRGALAGSSEARHRALAEMTVQSVRRCVLSCYVSGWLALEDESPAMRRNSRPHSGQRALEPRRSYPQFTHNPARLLRRGRTTWMQSHHKRYTLATTTTTQCGKRKVAQLMKRPEGCVVEKRSNTNRLGCGMFIPADRRKLLTASSSYTFSDRNVRPSGPARVSYPFVIETPPCPEDTATYAPPRVGKATVSMTHLRQFA